MRTPLGVFIILLLIILVDIYLFFVVRSLSSAASQRTRSLVYSLFWTISGLTITGMLLFAYTAPDVMGRRFRLYLFAVMVALFLSKLIALVFFIVDDLRRGIQWLASKLLFSGTEGAQITEGTISRSHFLSWLGLAAGGTLFGTMMYGFTNKYNYQLKRVRLHYDNLPEGFRGMKLVLFSDVHAGSFTNKSRVAHGVDMIMKENADLIIFSGDLVNDMATEMKNYMDLFGRVKAPLGVYSTFGNHDYGDYIRWPVNGLSKAQNLVNLEKVHADLGWNLLRNRHMVVERNGDKMPVIGVENWSNIGRFPKYGDLPKAYVGTEGFPFKLLISHDPSHWDAQVRPEFPDIDLMLSGHTHGMQFGVEIPGFRWSPVQYVYKQWDGLYEKEKQKLYVNPGYGFIGYPGRVGILPEVTVFEFA